MYSRSFNVLVLLLWLSTMGWLIHEKVLPPLRVGDPPDYDKIVQAADEEPVAWRLTIDEQPLGWAVTKMDRQDKGLTEIRNLVYFDRLPLRQFAQGWLGALVHLTGHYAGQQPMEADSTLWIDPLGRLSRFDSSVGFAGGRELIRLRGVLEGDRAELSIHAGDFQYRSEVPVPRDALVSDVFSPQTKLPGLRRGQTWSAPSFSPLRPPNRPVEILHATVEGMEPFHVRGKIEQVWVVAYRDDPGAELGPDDTVRGKMWVHPDGTVLRQEISMLNAVLGFQRLPDDEARRLHRRFAEGSPGVVLDEPDSERAELLPWPWPFEGGAPKDIPIPMIDDDQLR